jgi:hypothetical protein
VVCRTGKRSARPCLLYKRTREGTVHSVGGGRMVTTTMLMVLPMLMYDDADADDSNEIWCTMISYKEY